MLNLKKNELRLLVVSLILLLACSACSTAKPLEVPVCLFGPAALECTDLNNVSFDISYEVCKSGECVAMRVDDFQRLLETAKREKLKLK